MNPYNFIPLPEGGPDRRPLVSHDCFVGYTGEFKITLKALSPVIVCSGKDQSRPLQGNRHGEERYFIPGTTLKGMLRNIYEIVAGGCLRLTMPSNLRTPAERKYGGCEKKDYLCPSCRVFGMLHEGEVYKGNVSPGDLIGPVARGIRGETKLDVTVGRPKSEHEAFYRIEGKLRGRKGYYHQEKTVQGTLQTKTVYPLPPETAFQGRVSFKNLTLKEATLLYYCLVLEEGLAHKIGFGKAAGLGSAIIQIDSMKLADMGKRQKFKINWLDALPRESKAILDSLKSRRDLTWQTFKEIFSIHNIHGIKYSYPSYEWFKNNPQSSLEEFNGTLKPVTNLVIHNWTSEKFDIKADYILDWSSLFNRKTRLVPDQQVWNEKLLPALERLRKNIAESTAARFIRFRGKCCLSTGIAVGAVFPGNGSWVFEVLQPTTPWRSDAMPEAKYQLKINEVTSDFFNPDPNGNSIALVLSVTANATADVTDYIRNNSLQVKAIIAVEPRAGCGSLSIPNNKEAVSFALAARDTLKKTLTDYKVHFTHLFFNGPFALAIFLGQKLTSVGSIQLYEFKDPGYVQSCTLKT